MGTRGGGVPLAVETICIVPNSEPALRPNGSPETRGSAGKPAEDPRPRPPAVGRIPDQLSGKAGAVTNGTPNLFTRSGQKGPG